MKRLLVLMGIGISLGGAGCATSAPKVQRTMQAVPPGSAVVVGKFGILSPYKRGGIFYQLQALQVEGEKKWNLPLSTDDLGADGNSVAFFLELPPGIYMLTKWLYATSREQFEGEQAGVVFQLKPGEVTCIGAIYMGTRGKIPDTHGSTTHYRGGTVLKDECDVLASEIKARAPLLPPPVKRLAMGATQRRPAP